MGPPRRAVRCRDVTGRPGSAVTSRSLAERRPGPARWGRAEPPQAPGAPRGFTSAPSQRLSTEGARAAPAAPPRVRVTLCGQNTAEAQRTAPLFWGCLSPFWGPRRCLLPCGASPVAARPACSGLTLTGGPFSSYDHLLLLFISYRNITETTFWGRGG